MYPWLHVQVKLPGVLVHVALESQLLVVALAHSSILSVNCDSNTDFSIAGAFASYVFFFQESTTYQVETGNKCLLLTMYAFLFTLQMCH